MIKDIHFKAIFKQLIFGISLDKDMSPGILRIKEFPELRGGNKNVILSKSGTLPKFRTNSSF